MEQLCLSPECWSAAVAVFIANVYLLISLLISGAQRMRSAMAHQGRLPPAQGQQAHQGRQVQGQPTTSGGGVGGAAAAGSGSSAAADISIGPDVEMDPDAPVVQVKSRQGTVDFSDEVQTILDTGEIKLVKAMQKTTETQTDFAPVWFFGFDPTANSAPAVVTTPNGTEVMVEQQQQPAQRDIPAVDLSRFDQFSVIHYSDTRDPDNRKLVMIQTPGSKLYKPEELCSENLSVTSNNSASHQLGVDLPHTGRRGTLQDRKSKSVDNSTLSALMVNRAERQQHKQPFLSTSGTNDTDSKVHESILRRQDRVVLETASSNKPGESGDESATSHDGDLTSSLRDPDLDSGIWDMVHGRDARLSSSRDVTTPATSPKPPPPPVTTQESQHQDKDSETEEQEVQGAEGGEDDNGNAMDDAATWKEVYEQMGMAMPDSGDRPTMSYRVFHIEDQAAPLIDNDVTPELERLESPTLSEASNSPQPVTASTPNAKLEGVEEEERPEHPLVASCRDLDRDSDLGTELLSNDSTAEDVFADDMSADRGGEQVVEDSGYLFDKIPAMQGSLIHSPASPGTPRPFPSSPNAHRARSPPRFSLTDEPNEVMTATVAAIEQLTPCGTQQGLTVDEGETIVTAQVASVESSAPLPAAAAPHPSLPTNDSVESTDTVTEEGLLDDGLGQVEDLEHDSHAKDKDVKEEENINRVALSKQETLPISDLRSSPPRADPDTEGAEEEEEREMSMTAADARANAAGSAFGHSLFDEQATLDEEEESARPPEVGMQNLQAESPQRKKSAEISSPSSGTGEEEDVSVVEVSKTSTVSNGDAYESCEEALPDERRAVSVQTVITETITTETVTTRTISPVPSRRGSTSEGSSVKGASVTKGSALRMRSPRPSPLNSPTTSTPISGSPRSSKPSSPLARTFAASGSGSLGYGSISQTSSPDHLPERGCIVHRTGARPKVLPSTASMSPRRPPSKHHHSPMAGLQSIFSDDPGTLINGHAAERKTGGDDVYIVNRDGTLSSASSRTGSVSGVTLRGGARPKSSSMSGRPGASDLQSGLNSLMVRSTSSNVVHSHLVTELTAARARLNVPELRRTPDRHSVASSDSEYASVDSSLATSPTSTSVEELVSVGSDTCLLAEVMPVANYPDWMGNLPKRLHSVPITRLAIPGSNISLAIESEMRTDMSFSKCNLEMAEFLRKLPPLAVFDNFRKIMKDIWRAWMPKQILSVAKQLEAGVRYLDIHITKYRGTYYGEHGLYTRSLKHYLRHVEEFIQLHPKEVIILHFQRLVNMTPKDKRSLVTLLFQFFGAKLCRVMDTEHLTLDELWLSKKQVIAVFPDADMPALSNHIFAGLIWSSKTIRSSLPRKQTTEELMTYLESVYDEQRDPNDFHVLQAVVSPDMNMVFGDYVHKSMRSLTLCETSPYLKVWLAGKQHLNIVSVDFVGIYDLTGEIIQLNDDKKAITNV